MKGVEASGKKFKAYCSVDGKKIFLGIYHTELEAHKEYLKWRKARLIYLSIKLKPIQSLALLY
ncbi:hypothetical protein ACI51W_02415 (plasmid) [Pseudomonas marginalis]|uniref:hypothetical protein n=1 Tax=Pseudomonas marginalis TaxID=298 RepID=UPI00386C53A4